MNILTLFVFIILLNFCLSSSLRTENRPPLTVEFGKSVFLTPAHIPIHPKLKVADLCQIEVDDIQPLSSSVGFLKPKKFPCFFESNIILYQHEGSNLTSTDTIFLNIYFFRKEFSSVHNVTISVIIIAQKQPSRVTLHSFLFIKSWKGISQAISSKLISIRYNPDKEFCRLRHINQGGVAMKLYPWLATRFWPLTGVLITFNKSKVYEFNMECQQALLMGFQFMHRKSRSSSLDFLPVIIEISSLENHEIIDITYLHIPIHIASKSIVGISENLLPPPVIKAFRTIELTNAGGTLSLLPNDCLELSNPDKDRGPLIIQILSIQGSHQAEFRNLRDASKTIWSFTFTDLTSGLIAFQILSYSEIKEKVFRIDLNIMDSYFIKSDVLVLKLTNSLENKNLSFQAFSSTFYTYTSSNRPLRSINIQVPESNFKNLVKYRITNKYVTSGSFYKSPTTSLTSNPRSEFSYNDIKKSVVFYNHYGGLRESDLINIEVSIDKFKFIILQMPIYIVRIYNKAKESLLESYVKFNIKRDGIYKINIKSILNKNYNFYVNVRDQIDVHFDIVSQPQHGHLLKLFPGQNITTSSILSTSIRLQDLLDELIFYHHKGKLDSYLDTIHLKQRGIILDETTKIVFDIQKHATEFLYPRMNPSSIFTIDETTQYKKFSLMDLNYINNYILPEDIIYDIVRFPRYVDANESIDSGRLISLKSIQTDILVGDTALTTKITNYRSAHITSVMSFTQKQILDNDIAYIPPLDDIGPYDKKVKFLYTVKVIKGNEIRNVPFSILIKAVNNQPPILKNYDISVPRDEEVFISFLNLNIQDQDTKRKNILVELVTLPVYGHLYDRATKILRNGYKFQAYKLDQQLVKYKHNGYNINKDNFSIRLSDGIQTSSVYDIFINVTKRIIPISNWSLYINDSIIVKENSTVNLHVSIFQNVLQNFSFNIFPNPMFIIVGMPTRGNIFNRKVVVSNFYYNEVKRGIIAYKHSSIEIGSKPQFDFTQIWVLETGESFNLNFTIQPVNSQTPSFYSQVPLQVNEGGSAIISYYSISFTDLDSDEKDIFIQVIIPPKWGEILMKGNLKPVQLFSIKDIKLGKIIYSNVFSGNGSEQIHDVFTIRGTDGEFLSNPMEVQIFIHSVNDEPPNVILKSFNIAVGEKRIFEDAIFQISDADVPRDNIQIAVSKFPTYGNLSLKYNFGEIKFINRNSPPLTLQLLKFAQLVYIQNQSKIHFQNFRFPIKDEFGLTVTDGKYVVKNNATVNITGFNKISPFILSSLIKLNKIAKKVISNNELSSMDPDTLPEDILYTLLKPPSKGSLFLQNQKLSRLQTFTQDEIDKGRVKYVYSGPSVTFTKDDFLIKLSDGSFESTAKQVFIFLTQPIQIPKMTISTKTVKINIGRRFVFDKNLFVIKNSIADVVNSLVLTIKGKLTCGAFYYYTNFDYPIEKFTFEDLKERRILLFISECAEVVKYMHIPISMFSHKSFEQNLEMTVEIIPRVNAVPSLKINSTINALAGSNLLFTNQMLLVVDEDTPSDKITYQYLNSNQSFMQIFVNNEPATTFSQFDVNAEKVEFRISDSLNIEQTNVTLLVSDGENEGYTYDTFYQVSGLIILHMTFTNWTHDDLILMKYSVPSVMRFVDGYSAFQWTYDNLLVTRPDARITLSGNLVAGFFYNIQTKQSISSFTQPDINRGYIFYLLHKEKSSRIYKELIQFKIFYQKFRISSEVLELHWSIIEFEKTKYKLCPQRGLLSINVIRTGNLSSESRALIGFVSMESVINQDFRLMSDMSLNFLSGERKKIVSIKILMTGSVVKDNRFQVTLKSPTQAVFGEKSTTIISIKNRKSCGNKEYFLAEKTRKVPYKKDLPRTMKNMLHDFDGSSEDASGLSYINSDLPSSDDLDRQYKSYLSKSKSIIKCSKGWILFSKRCYRPFKPKRSWSDANKECINLSAFLVSVTSEIQQRWLSKLFSNPKSFWIGLHRDESFAKLWKYVNNEAVLYTNWAKGFPQYKGKKIRDCVLVTKNKRWKNRPCKNKRNSFVCMKNPEVTA